MRLLLTLTLLATVTAGWAEEVLSVETACVRPGREVGEQAWVSIMEGGAGGEFLTAAVLPWGVHYGYGRGLGYRMGGDPPLYRANVPWALSYQIGLRVQPQVGGTLWEVFVDGTRVDMGFYPNAAQVRFDTVRLVAHGGDCGHDATRIVTDMRTELFQWNTPSDFAGWQSLPLTHSSNTPSWTGGILSSGDGGLQVVRAY
jgi:hypothetical protein